MLGIDGSVDGLGRRNVPRDGLGRQEPNEATAGVGDREPETPEKYSLVLGFISFTFFAGIALVSNTIGRNSTTSVWTTLLFLFFAAMSLAMIADYFFARHRLTSEGLEYGRVLGQRGYVRWTEVRTVEYASVMKWFKLQTNSGATVRVSAMLIGLPVFAQHVLAHVPSDRIDGPTKSLLRETANGNPPNIWN